MYKNIKPQSFISGYRETHSTKSSPFIHLRLNNCI